MHARSPFWGGRAGPSIAYFAPGATGYRNGIAPATRSRTGTTSGGRQSRRATPREWARQRTGGLISLPGLIRRIEHERIYRPPHFSYDTDAVRDIVRFVRGRAVRPRWPGRAGDRAA